MYHFAKVKLYLNNIMMLILKDRLRIKCFNQIKLIEFHSREFD